MLFKIVSKLDINKHIEMSSLVTKSYTIWVLVKNAIATYEKKSKKFLTKIKNKTFDI